MQAVRGHGPLARRAELPGSVIFMFQPGEEGHGGAKIMIDEGVLDAAGDRPVAAYGLHVASAQLPGGVLSTRPGTIMAAADTFQVTVRGRAGTPPSRITRPTRSPPPARS